MIAASQAIQRSPDARLLFVDSRGRFRHALRSSLVDFLRPGDLVIANDAATIPASLQGIHDRTGQSIEIRLAGWSSFHDEDFREFSAIVFGEGDFRTPTENRPAPPLLSPGDHFTFGPLRADVESLLGHPRLIRLRFEGSTDFIWARLARYGRPIQYAHLTGALALWDVWTPIAGPPVAFEPPSAGFALDWSLLEQMRRRGVRFATVTHAAGISSTGDLELDARLPFDEPYRIPKGTATAIHDVLESGHRIIAIGTTVVRALEHAASMGPIEAGEGMANQRIGPHTRLRLVDVILSGTHEPGTSHYELLRAFAPDATLTRLSRELDSKQYRTHEFGDSVMIEANAARLPNSAYDWRWTSAGTPNRESQV